MGPSSCSPACRNRGYLLSNLSGPHAQDSAGKRSELRSGSQQEPHPNTKPAAKPDSHSDNNVILRSRKSRGKMSVPFQPVDLAGTVDCSGCGLTNSARQQGPKPLSAKGCLVFQMSPAPTRESDCRSNHDY